MVAHKTKFEGLAQTYNPAQAFNHAADKVNAKTNQATNQAQYNASLKNEAGYDHKASMQALRDAGIKAPEDGASFATIAGEVAMAQFGAAIGIPGIAAATQIAAKAHQEMQPNYQYNQITPSSSSNGLLKDNEAEVQTADDWVMASKKHRQEIGQNIEKSMTGQPGYVPVNRFDPAANDGIYFDRAGKKPMPTPEEIEGLWARYKISKDSLQGISGKLNTANMELNTAYEVAGTLQNAGMKLESAYGYDVKELGLDNKPKLNMVASTPKFDMAA